MTETTLLINLVTDNKTVCIPYGVTTTAEDVCILLCKQLSIGPVVRHLFALRVANPGKPIFLMPAATFSEKNATYDFRIRFKVANISRLKDLDRKAYDYYFHQARRDVLENKIPDLIYEKYKRELVGLGVTDMYRVMLEKDIPREIVESDYKKYIPKEVIKRHSIFIKKPIHDTLGKIKKAGHDAWYVKMEYLKQLEVMAPEYLAEQYKAVTDYHRPGCSIYVKVSPYHPTEPGIKICYESEREVWQQICTIEELCYISVRQEGTVEISRKNGIPFYLKLNSVPSMLSFVSLLDGYYRLTCKWIFNLCKDVPTPSLQKLYSIKCHGPVGGEFSYAKLEEKRGNHSGCFILRESETKYNTYYIDVCMKDNCKPKTFKLERLPGDEFIFNDDLRKYKSIHQLMGAYNDPQGYIYLQECLPPSEYDKSPLLLCQSDCLSGDKFTDSSAVNGIIPATPLCINSKDIQVYKGTYCYAITNDPDEKIIKQYCHIRKCKSAECKMAGTANDYIGQLCMTRSNRTCENWEHYILSKNKTKYNVTDTSYLEYLNSTLYPDLNVTKAENFCRNPSRNIAGTWCYTEDSGIQDICNIRDCNMPEECTILVKGEGEGRNVYILPQWKESGIHGGLHFALKEWNPDLLDGILFEIKPLNGDDKIKLVIGADNNQKILLYYESKLVKEKTFPHLIPAGKWVSFWMQIRRGEILLGYEGIPSALFEWYHDEPSAAFEPVFITYMSIQGHPMGVFFECGDCQSEITTVKRFSKIMPIGLWSQSESLLYYNLTLNIRGTGAAFIPLMTLPGTGEHYAVVLNELGNNLFLIRNKHRNTETLMSRKFNEPLITNNSWTTFIISFNEHYLNVTKNNTLIANYTSTSPMLIYWFSVGATNGAVTWTANCDPPDIDGDPLDGGWSRWSPWQCTVSCGGGEGFRTRTCSNPRPNIFGKLCEGSPTSTGLCNDFECGDVSPETMEKIRDHLQTHHFSLIIDEGDSVILENDYEILQVVKEQSPDAYYEWTLNGLFVVEEPGHIEFRGDNIFINKAEVSDMGVYVCMLHRINKERVVFRVISLAVSTTYDQITTRDTLDLTLTSNAVVLGYIYSDLRQKWLLNDTEYIDYGITTLAAVSAEYLKPLNQSHSGLWKCIIEQSDLQLSWITNLIKVKVKRPPNFYTHLKEDHLTAPLFAWLKTDTNILIAIILIIIFVCIVVAGCVFAYFRWGTLPTTVSKSKRKYKRNRRTD